MYSQEYSQVKLAIEGESLREAIEKANAEEGQNLNCVVLGWLQTGFKDKVIEYM